MTTQNTQKASAGMCLAWQESAGMCLAWQESSAGMCLAWIENKAAQRPTVQLQLSNLEETLA